LKKSLVFLFIAAVALALFFSPFASEMPDGLEKVAIEKEFEHMEKENPILDSPLQDYSVPFIKNEKVSTAISGIIGVLLSFLIAYSTGYFIKKKKKNI